MKSKLQEYADIIREGTEEVEKLEKDQTTIRKRITKVVADITTLRNLEKELWFELKCCNAALESKQKQLDSAKHLVRDIVTPSWPQMITEGPQEDIPY